MSRAASLLALLVLASPALADYTIVLKDGTRVAAKAKPEVKGNALLFQTPTGSPQKLMLTEVDEKKTEAANTGGLSGVQVLDTPGGNAPPPPTATPAAKGKSLAEVSRERRAAAQKTAIAEATPEPGAKAAEPTAVPTQPPPKKKG